MPTVVHLGVTIPRPATVASQSLAATLPKVAAQVADATGAPPPAVAAAVKKVVALHLYPPASPPQAAAQEDLASLASPDAQALAGAAHAALILQPDFWVSYYANQAENSPLPPSHPWAGIIAQALLAPAS